MLTDIFTFRYSEKTLWTGYSDKERRLIVQTFNLIKDLVPYWSPDGKLNTENRSFWQNAHHCIANELGLKSLSRLYYSIEVGVGQFKRNESRPFSMDHVCESWMFQPLTRDTNVDSYMKDRLSLVELFFRLREQEMEAKAAELEKSIQQARRFPNPGSYLVSEDVLLTRKDSLISSFRFKEQELNIRFQQAECKLHYHSGFIQIADDALSLQEIERPFWSIVSDQEWSNVDLDMKEALDQRDSGRGDPAFYAARALESAIKIISDKKGWAHGRENGAHNYIGNLSKKSSSFLEPWEAESLKHFFSKIRNPFGHGAGSTPKPNLTAQQTNWAIETCMSWVKSLVRRL